MYNKYMQQKICVSENACDNTKATGGGKCFLKVLNFFKIYYIIE